MTSLDNLKTRSSNRRWSNMFLMSFQNDLKIQDYFSDTKSDSSDEESEKEKQNTQIFLLNNRGKNIVSEIHTKLKDEIFTDQLQNELMEDNTKENDYENNITQRTFIYRLLGPVDAGSIRGSIFNLSIFSLGSGCLALPQKIAKISILASVITIILFGLATYWTLTLMVVSSRRVKNCCNYSKVVEILYGKKLSNFLTFTILIYTLGTMILYQVIGNYIFQMNMIPNNIKFSEK